METLNGTEWDILIEGTGFAQSLLALSLSRSGLKILHVDENEYYGGNEAALSLSEAEKWVDRYASSRTTNSFSHAVVTRNTSIDADAPQLASPRAYALSLAPQLLYAQSSLVPALVSSRVHNQLEFQAVGSWFISKQTSDNASTSPLLRVPNGREDVFQDTTFSLQTKRSLMKFLRFVAAFEDHPEKWEEHRQMPFGDFLTSKFSLPAESLDPILALTLAPSSILLTTTEFALPRIARHLRSIGVFGAGFGAVLPKWGGLAEIVQVACRACAVGGGVYALSKGVKSVENLATDGPIAIELSGGEKVTAKWLATTTEARLSPSSLAIDDADAKSVSKAICIISAPLPSLFPATSEGGVTPAGAVVIATSEDQSRPPVHILVHSSEAGECPSTQCILYASIELPLNVGSPLIEAATTAFLGSVDREFKAEWLWSLRYQQNFARPADRGDGGNVVLLPPLSPDLVVEDRVLDDVKKAWAQITGGNTDDFMKFDVREGMIDDENM